MIARENTERLARLVDETLDLERLQAGRVDVDPRPVRPAELLAATAQVVQPVADAAGVDLDWEAPESLELMADPDRIVQALVNLVANAIKFSPAGTCVRTSVESRDGEALISVADDGRGIPADQLEAVFERFQQVDASDRAREGRHRARAGDLPRDRRPARRPDLGRERARAGRDVPLHAAALPRRGPVAVYDRRAAGREELARAVRRHGRRVVVFESPEAIAASSERFVAVVTDAELDADPGVPVLRSGELGELPG